MYKQSKIFMLERARELENIFKDIPTVVQSLIAENEYGTKINLFDLYVPNTFVVDSDEKLYADIYSMNSMCFEEQSRNTVRLSCHGERFSGKTTFLKAIFCSLALQKKAEISRWWYLSYGITPDMYPFYLSASEIDKIEWNDFRDVLTTSIRKSVVMRHADENELQQLEMELDSILEDGKLLLLIDDADNLKIKSIVELHDFLKAYPACHAIFTYSSNPLTLMDIGTKLEIPRLDVDSDVLLTYSEHLCDALGCGAEYQFCKEYLMKSASVRAYAKYYIHTPIDLLYLILSTGVVNKNSALFKSHGGNIKLNLNSMLRAMIHIRKEYISEDSLDFFSERAYISMVNAFSPVESEYDLVKLERNSLKEFSMPQTLCSSEEPEHIRRIMKIRERNWNYFLEAQEAGIAGIKTDDDGIHVTKQFVFVNQQFQAWLAARYVANEQNLSELPKALSLLYPDDFIIDFWACLFEQEKMVFLRLFKKMLSALPENELQTRILTIFGMLWRIDWDNIHYFHGEVADRLLSSYFNSGKLLYEPVMAELLHAATHIESSWIDKILCASAKDFHNTYDNTFSVLLRSSLCSEDYKKEICRRKAMSEGNHLSDIAFFRSLNKETLAFVQKAFLELSVEKETDLRKLSNVYAELISVIFDSSDSKLAILRNLFFSEEHKWQQLSAIYLLKYMDEYKEFLPDIVVEIMEVNAHDIDGIDPDVEAFMIDALNRIDDISFAFPLSQTFQSAYAELLIRNPEQIVVLAEMLVALQTPREIFSPECVSFMKKQFCEDKRHRIYWAKLLLLADKSDFLSEHLVDILHMRQLHKTRIDNTNYLTDILVAVTQSLGERSAVFDDYDTIMEVEVVELDGKEYIIANRKKILDKEYVLLLNDHNPVDFLIRRVLVEGGQEYLTKLDSDTEFDIILQGLMTNAIEEYSKLVEINLDGTHEIGSDQFVWDKFVDFCSKNTRIGDFVIAQDTILKYKGTDRLVIIPKGIKVIGENAFRNCQHVQGVVFQEGVSEIKQYAFANCEELQVVEFVDSIERIEEGAFIGTKLKEVVLHSPCRIETLIKANGQHLFLSVDIELPIEQGQFCDEVTVDKTWLSMNHGDNSTGDKETMILSFPPKCRIYTILQLNLNEHIGSRSSRTSITELYPTNQGTSTFFNICQAFSGDLTSE